MQVFVKQSWAGVIGDTVPTPGDLGTKEKRECVHENQVAKESAWRVDWPSSPGLHGWF